MYRRAGTPPSKRGMDRSSENWFQRVTKDSTCSCSRTNRCTCAQSSCLEGASPATRTAAMYSLSVARGRSSRAMDFSSSKISTVCVSSGYSKSKEVPSNLSFQDATPIRGSGIWIPFGSRPCAVFPALYDYWTVHRVGERKSAHAYYSKQDISHFRRNSQNCSAFPRRPTSIDTY